MYMYIFLSVDFFHVLQQPMMDPTRVLSSTLGLRAVRKFKRIEIWGLQVEYEEGGPSHPSHASTEKRGVLLWN